MSLKKRMFRSNMTILFSALIALMVIILAVLVIFEETFERQLRSMSQTRLEDHVETVAGLLREGVPEEAETLRKSVGEWGYELAVVSKGKILYGDSSDDMEDLAEMTEAGGQQSTDTAIFSYLRATVVTKYVPEEEVYIMAAYFPEKIGLTSILQRFFSIFFLAVLLIGMTAIVVLLFLASYFTRKMNRMIMEPMEALTAGAERIQSGNLTEAICYKGEEEFEHVCQAFNAMQYTILKDREARARTERARIDMVTGISHDLRTPLTSIQGYIKGVMDGVANTPEKRERYLQTAYESTEEMNVLLQKLFDFSRLESGQMPLHMVRADLAEYAAAYASKKEAAADPAQVKIIFHKPDRLLPEIAVDVDQIQRILDNLLENSIKYAGIRPVQIDLSVYASDDRIWMEWKDNGKGVPEEKLPRIFERFYRCDESRQEKGSGVGLYVVQYIMKCHHGEATAENDGGLKIRLAFPRED